MKLKTWVLNQRNIFLLDGIGAGISSLLTAFVFPIFSQQLGLTNQFLYNLAFIPFFYMIYSLYCYFILLNIKIKTLNTIIVANLIYCCITATIILFHNNISFYGQCIFAIEILVILLLVKLEIKITKNLIV